MGVRRPLGGSGRGVVSGEILYVYALFLGPVICNAKRRTTRTREIKGRFRKRVGSAYVPSFRFSFQGNMRTYPRSGFWYREHPNVPSFRFSFQWEHPPKPPFWKATLLSGNAEVSRNPGVLKFHERRMVICLPVTSRPLISLQKKQFYHLVTSRPPI